MNIEARVQIIEERMDSQSHLLVDMRQSLLQFEARVDRRFEQIEDRLGHIDVRFTALEQKVDAGFARLDQKIDVGFARLDQKIDVGLAQLDQKIEAGLAQLDQKIGSGLAQLDQRVGSSSALVSQEIASLRRDMTMQMSTQLRWTAGMMLTGLVAIVAALVTR